MSSTSSWRVIGSSLIAWRRAALSASVGTCLRLSLGEYVIGHSSDPKTRGVNWSGWGPAPRCPGGTVMPLAPSRSPRHDDGLHGTYDGDQYKAYIMLMQYIYHIIVLSVLLFE